MNFEKEIIFDYTRETITVDDFNNIYVWLLNYDCPELMQINSEWNFSYINYNNIDYITLLKPVYQMDETQYHLSLLEINDVFNKFQTELGNKNDYEKQLYIHDYIVNSVTYDADAEWSNSPYGVFYKKQARCEGLCKAFSWCMWALDVECFCVVGNANGIHSWNIIKINDTYSFVDLTWDNSNSTKDITSRYYLNINNELLFKTHKIDDNFINMGLPNCSSLDNWYPILNNEYIESNNKIDKVLADSIKKIILNNQQTFILVFKDENTLSTFKDNFETYIANANKINNVNYEYNITIRYDILTITFKLITD